MPAHVWAHSNGLPHIAKALARTASTLPPPMGERYKSPVTPVEHALDDDELDTIVGIDEASGKPYELATLGSELSELSGPYAERGDAIASLLDAVCSGALLEVEGPTAFCQTVRARIGTAGGKRYARAEGDAIGPVLVELARKWKAR